jgi:hypothetical protein
MLFGNCTKEEEFSDLLVDIEYIAEQLYELFLGNQLRIVQVKNLSTTSNLHSIPELSDSDPFDDCSKCIILKFKLRKDRDFNPRVIRYPFRSSE